MCQVLFGLWSLFQVLSEPVVKQYLPTSNFQLERSSMCLCISHHTFSLEMIFYACVFIDY